MNF
ncbi:hypothetical protein VCHC51A1_3502, partial [Vibrio cholerae HC-51A1]|jgi:structural maintenance of chromosome 4